ncbi:hypothetical protein BDW59DRAFT_155507, partial [Aspergillus cavernicola]
MADLEYTRPSVNALVASLPGSWCPRAHFVPTNIVKWDEITALFREARERFGRIEVVLANAGVMERDSVLDMDNADEQGDLRESQEFSRVIDFNVKGTMNFLRQALFSMKGNPRDGTDSERLDKPV